MADKYDEKAGELVGWLRNWKLGGIDNISAGRIFAAALREAAAEAYEDAAKSQCLTCVNGHAPKLNEKTGEYWHRTNICHGTFNWARAASLRSPAPDGKQGKEK